MCTYIPFAYKRWKKDTPNSLNEPKNNLNEHKNNLKAFLKPLGWKGYTMDGLTPNMTRRAQVATWLLYYREALHGVPIDELRRRRERRAQEEAARKAAGEVIAPTGTSAQSVV